MKNFKEILKTQVEQIPNDDFLVVTDGREEVRKTYAEFSIDVESAVSIFAKAPSEFSVVGLRSGNVYGQIVSFFAAWFSGRSVCLFHPGESQERLEKKLAQLGRSCLLLESMSAGKFEIENFQKFSFSETEEVSEVKPMTYVFTSGSTGFSKIVPQTEDAWLQNTQALRDRLHFKRGIRVATPLPLFHVNALGFLLATLSSGGCFCVMTSFQTSLLNSTLERERIEVLSLVPSVLRPWLMALRKDSAKKFPNLKIVNTAASFLSPDLVTEFIERFPCRLNQGYGLSEAVNFSVLNDPGISEDLYRKVMTEFPTPSIGFPVEGNEIEILGGEGQILEASETGEIVVRGKNVMRGYHRESHQPFWGEWLKTGDLGSYELIEGKKYFFISSRIKDVVKRAGETISLVEMDEIASSVGILAGDVISFSFENENVGEEIGWAIQKGSESRDLLIARFKKKIETLPPFLRPRVLAFTEKELRTASGKPLRWKFSAEMLSYKTQTILGLLVIDLT